MVRAANSLAPITVFAALLADFSCELRELSMRFLVFGSVACQRQTRLERPPS